MDRNTLAWYSCSLCGRKGAVYECIVDGSRISLCPYCALALSSAGRRVSCRGLKLSTLQASVRSIEADVEDLLARVKGGLQTRTPKRQASTLSSGKYGKKGSRRRRYSAGAT